MVIPRRIDQRNRTCMIFMVPIKVYGGWAHCAVGANTIPHESLSCMNSRVIQIQIEFTSYLIISNRQDIGGNGQNWNFKLLQMNVGCRFYVPSWEKAFHIIADYLAAIPELTFYGSQIVNYNIDQKRPRPIIEKIGIDNRLVIQSAYLWTTGQLLFVIFRSFCGWYLVVAKLHLTDHKESW